MLLVISCRCSWCWSDLKQQEVPDDLCGIMVSVNFVSFFVGVRHTSGFLFLSFFNLIQEKDNDVSDGWFCQWCCSSTRWPLGGGMTPHEHYFGQQGCRRLKNWHHFLDFILKWLWHQGKLAFSPWVSAWFVPMLKHRMYKWQKCHHNCYQ